MRNAFARALCSAALKDERIYVLAADISPAGPLVEFAKAFPRRFINVGVAEQAMIGMAAGLALKGLRPFCYTIATFALYRPFEFIRDDLAYQKLPVVIVGMGSGLNYSTLGSTHHAMEDVAVATSIPGMQVIAPYDPFSTELAVDYLAEYDKGPTYLRLGKAGEPDFLCQNNYDDTLITGYGPILGPFSKDFDVLPIIRLKPLEEDEIAKFIDRYPTVAVVEEHTPWLGPRIQAIAHKYGLRTYVHSFALKDEFIHFHGEYQELLKLHELTYEDVVAKLRQKAHISRNAETSGDTVSVSEPVAHVERR